MEETLVVTIPGHSAQLVPYRPLPGEGDDDIARRQSHKFVPGTILGIDGAKWRIDGPGKVTLVFDPIDGMYPHGDPEIKKLKQRLLFDELAARTGTPPVSMLAVGSGRRKAPAKAKRAKVSR